MHIKSIIARPVAGLIAKNIKRSALTAVPDQEQWLIRLLKTGRKTDFGREHHLKDVSLYNQFKQAVPIRDYEQIRPWIDRVVEGKHNVLWKGRPLYFAKTSGTTSGVKYIPITKDSVGNHFGTARNAALCYAAETGNTRFLDGKLIFLSGSPELERVVFQITSYLVISAAIRCPVMKQTALKTGKRNFRKLLMKPSARI
jgi:hypothetical protein